MTFFNACKYRRIICCFNGVFHFSVCLVGPIGDFLVRWNSTYLMLDRFVKHRHIITEIIAQPDWLPHINLAQETKPKSKKFEFDTHDWNLLIGLHLTFKLFTAATTTLSGSNYSTIGFGHHAVVAFHHHLLTPIANDSLQLKCIEPFLLGKFILNFEKRCTSTKQISLLVVALYLYFTLSEK